MLNQGTDMLEMVIEQRRHGLGGFEIGRILPFTKHRMVGTFVFIDPIGPATRCRPRSRCLDYARTIDGA